jgi:hypothetical protein
LEAFNDHSKNDEVYKEPKLVSPQEAEANPLSEKNDVD